MFRPIDALAKSGLDLFDSVVGADFPQTLLRYRNQGAAQSISLDTLSDADWIAHLGRFVPLNGAQDSPLALRYHGHQFRHYNPDLGDGRGFLLAQCYDDHGRLLDLGTKGSGQTPYSRRGDGRLTLKGGVREVLATTLLEALGVNTSKSLSLIETGENLHRGDEPSPTRSSVLVRLSHSHIRFGTFERLAYFNDTKTMGGLIDYVCTHYYPQIAETGEAKIAALFDQAITATAKTCADWMAAGFVHGVLNTDNMNITGESFDYGPYRFLPRYDPDFTAAYFDHSGLYAYGRQADAVFWNLGQLGRSLSLICPSEALLKPYNDFDHRYGRALEAAFCRRLNIVPQGEAKDKILLTALFALMKELRFDQSFEGVIFDWQGGLASSDRALSGARASHYKSDLFEDFFAALAGYECANPARLTHPRLAEANPETLLIDEIEHLWARLNLAHEWEALDAKLKAIETYGQAMGR